MKYLNKNLQYLKGVGQKRASLIAKLECKRYINLLLHLPKQYIDRSNISTIDAIQDGKVATLFAEVVAIDTGRSKYSGPLRIHTIHENTAIEIVYFAGKSYMKNLFKVGSKIIISGQIKVAMQNKLQMHHPDYALPFERKSEVMKIEPIYPLTAGVTNKHLAFLIEKILTGLELFKNNVEWLDENLLSQNQWPNWFEALKTLHAPKTLDTHKIKKARERLSFDEVLAHIISMRLMKINYHTLKAMNSYKPLEAFGDARELCTHPLIKQCIELLPFELTAAQGRVLQEICSDIDSEPPMQRLVQGDVGSGKTIVAFLASLFVAYNKAQVVIIVPTEVLAKQHFNKLQPLAEQLGIRLDLLISAIPNSAKKNIKECLKLPHGDERIDIIIGTHAVLQDDVAFNNLSLVVFDEQHKFGVAQREMLLQKGENVNYMMMSATPIPRTLSLISYADKDLSIIDEKPQNRKAVNTISLSDTKLNELLLKLSNVLERGEKIFWLCPLVEESETDEENHATQQNETDSNANLMNVYERFHSLEKLYPGIVGFIHGKMKPHQKDEVMQKLIDGTIQILVATTVIEVGVDVPDATLIVIENCERYGLSQLHQLRGRVGRSHLPGTCILMHKKNVGHITMQRIRVIKDSDDGFFIANQDLKLRGQGDLTGLKQSGVPDFKIYNVLEGEYILEKALAFANKIENTQGYERYRDMISLYKNQLSLGVG